MSRERNNNMKTTQPPEGAIEIFKEIPGTNNRYLVGNLGTIKHYKNGKRKLRVNDFGYLRIVLPMNNKWKCKFVHRLVAEAFILNTDSKPFINHKDGNKRNNVFTNLEWCTRQENQLHALRNKLYIHAKGEDISKKLNNQKVIFMRSQRNFSPNFYRKMAAKYNISYGQVYKICRNTVWKHLPIKLPVQGKGEV